MASQKTVGILGGGQLGRMLAHEAAKAAVPLLILDSGDSTPAKQVIQPPAPHSAHPDGSFASAEAIRALASNVDILTVEIEHVDADVLEEIQKEGKVEVHPDPKTIRIIQDKFRQKQHLAQFGISVAPFMIIDSATQQESIAEAVKQFGLPLMLKARTLAYDGRGNFALKSLDQVEEALKFLGDRPLYAEKWAPFKCEIAVMVVRTPEGLVKSYDPVETVHEDSILRLVLAPLRRGQGINERAREMAEKAVGCLVGAGIFGVEMFLMDDGSLYINEIAPRPHNSGHHTIEACHTSQFANHLRSILSLPLGSTSLQVPATAMVNLIGQSSSMDSITNCVTEAYKAEGASVHLYGKTECRKGRKMGHITFVANSQQELIDNMRETFRLSLPSTSKLPSEFTPSLPSPSTLSSQLFSHPQPLVGIIMGSDSDLPVMMAAVPILNHFKVPFELSIVSAHRTPERMVEYANAAAGRGLKCIIAGAGGAAHLPGMVAALTALPVVGVPVKGSSLDGVDSLYSIVQMPRGIPTATVAINNATNAGLLAVRIVSAADPRLITAMEAYLEGLKGEVMAKVDKLETIGWDKYLAGMGKK